MKKIFIQKINNKFIDNLSQSELPGFAIAFGHTDGVLYKIHHQYNFDIYVFSVSAINNEIIQFIIEFRHAVKVFLYHDIQPTEEFIDQYGSLFHHLSIEPNQQLVKNTKIPNNLVNTTLYKRLDIVKNDSIVFFLDGLNHIPPNIEKVLYPNTMLPIKLFNNNTIVHPQNLGLISELDKATILNEALYFISHNNFYEQEAALCGCKILNSNNIDINDAKIITPNIITYEEFIKNIL